MNYSLNLDHKEYEHNYSNVKGKHILKAKEQQFVPVYL